MPHQDAATLPTAIGQYQPKQRLYQSRKTVIYAAESPSGERVVIKVPADEEDEGARERIAYEAQLLEALQIAGIPQLVGSAEEARQHGHLVRAYVPGITLGDYLKQLEAPLGMESFLTLAEQLAKILAALHQSGIAHRDLNPQNILIDPDTFQVYLIDLGIASKFDLQSPPNVPPQQLEGTLTYISPEQTGRMNRGVDYRTDLYSLGITYYEMLTGQPPFQSTDPLELVHAHLALTPRKASDLRAEAPELLNQLLLRLLAKDPENRYQSAEGLGYDLSRLAGVVGGSVPAQEVTLGVQDHPLRFEVSQRLYGRDQERELLLQAFGEIKEAGKQLILLGGHSGVGKSALVAEVHKPMTEARGQYLSGKFDQMQRSITHFAWRQSVEKLASLLLSESEEVLAAWRHRIGEAIGENGALITGLSPAMEQVLGPQPALTPLDAAGTQNRFHLVMKRFFEALARPEQPLVIFLDDWQWADQASVILLKELFLDPDLQHVLFICAYRDNEVDEGHVFSQTMKEVAAETADATLQRITRMQLGPLESKHIRELLRETFRQEGDYLDPLTTKLTQKTLGNAFFVHQLLKSLHQQQVIQLERSTGSFSWSLDLKALDALNITANVVEFMISKLDGLPQETKELLQFAACIGNTFPLSLLGRVVEETRNGLQARLMPALQEGLIVPLGGQTGHYTTFRFAHDSVQKAFYELIPAQDRAPYHLRLAKKWEADLLKDRSASKLFDIANAFNAGKEALESASELRKVADLNLQAAKMAQNASAYTTALEYARAGIACLQANSWKEDYALARDLYRAALENAYYVGGGEETAAWLQILLDEAQTTLDRVLALEIKMDYHKARQEYVDAFEVGMEVVKMQGIKLRKPNLYNIIVSIFGAKIRLDRIGMDDLLNLPVTDDPEAEAMERTLLNLGIVVYFSRPEYLPILAPAQVQVMLKNGHTVYSPYTYMSFALNMIAGLGNISYGYRLGKLGEKLATRLKPTKLEGRIGFMHRHFVRHWLEPVREVVKAQQELYYRCLEIGDFEFASYAAVSGTKMSFVSGMPLREVKDNAINWQKALREKLRIPSKYTEYLAVHLLPSWLTDDARELMTWEGEPVDEEALVSAFEEGNNGTALAAMFWGRMNGWLVLGDIDKAWENVLEFEKYLGSATATVDLVQYTYAKSLIIAQNPKVLAGRDARKHKKFMRTASGKLRKWAKQTPENYRHKHLFIDAERARLGGNYAKAQQLYQQVQTLATEGRMFQDAAMAHERSANLCQAQEQTSLAKFHILEAHSLYRRWQCTLKVQQLEENFSGWFMQTTREGISVEGTQTTRTFDIDLMSIIKSSQAISGEIVLGQLLEKMLEVVLENAGAQRGVLLFMQKQKLVVQAEIDYTNGFRAFAQNQSLDEHRETAPGAIVYYVARSAKTLVLSDPHQDGQFQHDPYLTARQPRNVLGIPLLKQGQLLGVLYLEHYSAQDMFGTERLSVLNLLSSQIAISLENALLYDDLEGKVKERTAEVMKQKNLIEVQKEEIQKSNDKVMASIRYAKDIQTAMLMPRQEVSHLLPDSFILFKPRDVVSGDFYWVREQSGKIFVAAVDCTGHGVPGALMSMVGNSLMDEILTKKRIENPEEMLDDLQVSIRVALRQQDSRNRDGMDLALAVIDKEAGKLYYSGARNPLVYHQQGEIHQVKGDRMSIGGSKEFNRTSASFTCHTLPLQAEDGSPIPTTFYLFSDGYQDQFGGAEGSKFSIKRFRHLLAEIAEKPMEEQEQQLDEALTSWMHAGQEEQIDDVLVIGVRV